MEALNMLKIVAIMALVLVYALTSSIHGLSSSHAHQDLVVMSMYNCTLFTVTPLTLMGSLLVPVVYPSSPINISLFEFTAPTPIKLNVIITPIDSGEVSLVNVSIDWAEDAAIVTAYFQANRRLIPIPAAYGVCGKIGVLVSKLNETHYLVTLVLENLSGNVNYFSRSLVEPKGYEPVANYIGFVVSGVPSWIDNISLEFIVDGETGDTYLVDGNDTVYVGSGFPLLPLPYIFSPSRLAEKVVEQTLNTMSRLAADTRLAQMLSEALTNTTLYNKIVERIVDESLKRVETVFTYLGQPCIYRFNNVWRCGESGFTTITLETLVVNRSAVREAAAIIAMGGAGPHKLKEAIEKVLVKGSVRIMFSTGPFFYAKYGPVDYGKGIFHMVLPLPKDNVFEANAVLVERLPGIEKHFIACNETGLKMLALKYLKATRSVELDATNLTVTVRGNGTIIDVEVPGYGGFTVKLPSDYDGAVAVYVVDPDTANHLAKGLVLYREVDELLRRLYIEAKTAIETIVVHLSSAWGEVEKILKSKHAELENLLREIYEREQAALKHVAVGGVKPTPKTVATVEAGEEPRSTGHPLLPHVLAAMALAAAVAFSLTVLRGRVRR